MHLAELLSMEAYDEQGAHMGQVHDVRVRLQRTSETSWSMVFEGIVVGKGAISARLGYAYGEVAGPWPVNRIMRRLGRSVAYVPWDDVVSLEDGRVVVGGIATNYSSAAEAQEAENA